MKVAFVYNVKLSKPSLDLDKQKDIEFDSPETISAIAKTIKGLGHRVFQVEADLDAYQKLRELKERGKVDIVFNIAEGLGGDARESQVPLFCEMLKIPYTHSSPTVQALRSNKELTKILLMGAGIVKVPGRKKFPLIVKPNSEGSSRGILDRNVVENTKDLEERINALKKTITGNVLVEEYIKGREFTVGILGNDPPRVLPIVEQKFDFIPKGMNGMASYELKWIYEDSLKDLRDAYECPAKLTSKLKKEIEKTSLEIYDFLEVKDCARIDYRLDSKNDLYFLEINTLPGINPDEKVISYFPIASRAAGMEFGDLISSILSSACRRYGIDQ